MDAHRHFGPTIAVLTLIVGCSPGSGKVGKVDETCDDGVQTDNCLGTTWSGTGSGTGTGTGTGTGSGTGSGTGTGTGGGTGSGTGTGTGTGSTTQGVSTWVGTDDPGTGPGGALYEVEATVDSSRDPNGGPGSWVYDTDMEVRVFDAAGAPASGLSVHLDTTTLGSTQLTEDVVSPGLYTASVVGYARTYTLQLNPADPSTNFTAELVGPEPHVFASLPPAPWDVSQPFDVQWSPYGADFAEASTNGSGTMPVDDDGMFTIPANNLDYVLGELDEELLTLKRWNRLDLTGALPGSWFEVSVEIESVPTDTTDSRRSSLTGTITLPNPSYYYYNGPYQYGYREITGDVYVLLWPDAVDPATTPYWHWATIPDASFYSVGNYQLPSLEPGEWQIVAYVDTDGSDVGLAQPAGPSLGEPSNHVNHVVDPASPAIRNITLWDAWSGF